MLRTSLSEEAMDDSKSVDALMLVPGSALAQCSCKDCGTLSDWEPLADQPQFFKGVQSVVLPLCSKVGLECKICPLEPE